MQIETTIAGDRLTVKICRRFDMPGSLEFDSKTRKALQEGGFKSVTVDFSDALYISSIGLRSLLIFKKEAALKNIPLQLSNLGPEVREIMDASGISAAFEIV